VIGTFIISNRLDDRSTKLDAISTNVDDLSTKVDGLSAKMDEISTKLDGKLNTISVLEFMAYSSFQVSILQIVSHLIVYLLPLKHYKIALLRMIVVLIE
jgi:uncharacterized protein YoxC